MCGACVVWCWRFLAKTWGSSNSGNGSEFGFFGGIEVFGITSGSGDGEILEQFMESCT